MFSVTSRYSGIETAKWVAPDGRQIAYLRRRFLPNTPAAVLAEHPVTQGDRLDNITARYLGDPEQFWRLCDANDAMHPDETTAEIGRRLIIPLIQGRLGMLDRGVRLQLMLGANVPMPAPAAVVDALVSLEVTNRDQERDGFQLTLSLGKDSPLEYGLLLSGLLDPPNRIIITVIIGVLPQVLIDGIITSHQVVPSNQPGESRLVITGEDISLKLDFEEKSKTYPNQPDSVIVTRILAQYGLIPKVTPTTDIPIQLQRIPSQQGTDLAFIQQLAQRNGFVFYVEPGPLPGINFAHWGPDNRLGMPQPALTLNMGSDTNVDSSINFNFNALGPASPQVTIVEPFTRLAISIPVPNGLQPPLASRPTPPLRKTIARNSANLNPAQAALRAVSSMNQSSDALTATGEVDAVRYGRALRSRRLVGVRGAGLSYNGTYYVREVTHQIQPGRYKQRFTLTREGRGALTPVVAP